MKRLMPAVALLVCLATLVGVVMLASWWRVLPVPGVTRENFHRLRAGMTPGQVERALGTGRIVLASGGSLLAEYRGTGGVVQVGFASDRLIRATLLTDSGGEIELEDHSLLGFLFPTWSAPVGLASPAPSMIGDQGAATRASPPAPPSWVGRRPLAISRCRASGLDRCRFPLANLPAAATMTG